MKTVFNTDAIEQGLVPTITVSVENEKLIKDEAYMYANNNYS